MLTHQLRINLFARASGAHGVGLAGAGLAVGEDGDVVALNEGGDAFAQVGPDAVLVDVLGEDLVEDEQALALGRLDHDVCRRGNVTDGSAKALRHQIMAGLAGLQRRSDANGCTRAKEKGSS